VRRWGDRRRSPSPCHRITRARCRLRLGEGKRYVTLPHGPAVTDFVYLTQNSLSRAAYLRLAPYLSSFPRLSPLSRSSSLSPSPSTMKSCLKCTTPPNTLAPPTPAEPASSMSAEAPDHRPPLCNKHVSFCDRGSEQVFVADEWDRTPMDPARKLSYA
jgi:hypothetical protein